MYHIEKQANIRIYVLFVKLHSILHTFGFKNGFAAIKWAPKTPRLLFYAG